VDSPGRGPNAVRLREVCVGAAAGMAIAGAAECVCCKEKAQGFVLRESAGRHDATLRLLADLLALASHYGINL